mmetsp:Transcript_54567/g.116582  ORF Transcript_54567/g.116582 Transcript_54567/m.116582 type:complete len:379 (+) Transcript_54567:131-1267(+)
MNGVIDLCDSDEEDGVWQPSSPSRPPASKKPRLALGKFPLLRIGAKPVIVRTNGRDRPIPDSELPRHAPATILRNALPADKAEALLQLLLKESQETWKRGKWFVHGKEHVVPRDVGLYYLGIEPFVDGEEEPHRLLKPPDEMVEAAQLLSKLVTDARPAAHWNPTLALANRYDRGTDCVGWHSDHLNLLGPRPIILGLSLGATRNFKLRPVSVKSSSSKGKGNPKAKAKGATATAGKSATQQEKGSESAAVDDDAEDDMTVTIPMPHNTAVVMWDDCQEAWHHAVPRQADSTIGRHATAGLVRVSLTFRMARPEFGGANTKNCRCGRPTALRSRGGRYFLTCNPAGASKQCGFWEPCPWAQEEAERLKKELSEQSVST